MTAPPPPHGLDEFEGVVTATAVPIISMPAAWVRELVAYLRALEKGR